MYRLGIDLGGTNIASGVVDKDYKIIGVGKVKTNAPRPAEEIIDDMAKSALMAVKDAGLTIDDISSVGVGTPGSVIYETGVVSYSNNLGFFDVPLAKMLEKRLGKKVYIENDANAAAYGEYIAGAGKGAKNFVAITLGTGVGGGIITEGKIYSGSNFAGGELGHTVIQMNGEVCTCGRNGCFEAYASATALIRQTKQAMTRYPESIMWKLCDNNIENVNGITAFDAAREGDKAGIMVVEEYRKYLAVGIANMINIFQPDVLCVGGGISHEGEFLMQPIREMVKGENYARNMSKNAEIKAATLGNDAGIIGAAFLDNI
ncbi:MAG: ROK family protein [Clostridia bacterium]|nr:ROK family protein [Clostridia bacterium]